MKKNLDILKALLGLLINGLFKNKIIGGNKMLLLDRFQPVRVLSEDEVKNELERMRNANKIKTLATATGIMALLKASPNIDLSVMSAIKSVKLFLNKEIMFLGVLPIGMEVIIFAIVCLLIYCYCIVLDIVNNSSEAKK